MKCTLICLAAALVLGSGESSHGESRAATDHDRKLAKAAADWLIHDDWGQPTPTNGISNTQTNRIAEIRESLKKRQSARPIAFKAGTNDWVFFSYNVESRVLEDRPTNPDPWPLTEVEIWYSISQGSSRLFDRKKGDHILNLRLGGSSLLQLTIDEREQGIAILRAIGPGYVD